MPQIYLNDAEMARQWARISLYGYESGGTPIEFDGVMTQYVAYAERGGHHSLDNTPSRGWRQLWAELFKNALLRQRYAPWSTDIRWNDPPDE